MFSQDLTATSSTEAALDAWEFFGYVVALAAALRGGACEQGCNE